MAWDPATGIFPLSNISMSQIRLGFNRGGDAIPSLYTLSSLVGKILYNTDGTTYTVPAITPTFSLSLQYFLGRYYLNPAPLTRTHLGNQVVALPGPSRPTPTRFSVTVYGPGGGGGGGGGSYDCTIYFDTQDGGGGGGGGAGETVSADFTYDGSIITNIGGEPGRAGGGGGWAACTQAAGMGGRGSDGAALVFTYGSNVVEARGGKGGEPGTGAGYDGTIGVTRSYRGVGGLGGQNGNPTTGAGQNGSTPGAGGGGSSAGLQPGGRGGNGGLNRYDSASTETLWPGQAGRDGQQGFISITWYFT